jgi:hypothetical protein
MMVEDEVENGMIGTRRLDDHFTLLFPSPGPPAYLCNKLIGPLV